MAPKTRQNGQLQQLMMLRKPFFYSAPTKEVDRSAWHIQLY